MYEITIESTNKDSSLVYKYFNFKSKLPSPKVYPSPERSDIFIFDCSKSFGLKALSAERLVASIDKPICYAVPRVGWAAPSIAKLCELYGNKAIFFAPASKVASPCQLSVLAYKGCELRFVRIPAMPTLNAWIKTYCAKMDYYFMPFGLSGLPSITNDIISLAREYSFIYGDPKQFYCAVSTGTLIRALELAWPNSEGFGVAVSRNIKDGEKGRSKVISYHKDFYEDSDYMPSFPTTSNYDAKAYKIFIEQAKPGSVFINVGADSLLPKPKGHILNSQREWGDLTCFDKGVSK
jgi:hypothetical protein